MLGFLIFAGVCVFLIYFAKCLKSYLVARKQKKNADEQVDKINKNEEV